MKHSRNVRVLEKLLSRLVSKTFLRQTVIRLFNGRSFSHVLRALLASTETYLGDFSLQSRRNGGRRVTGRVLWINLARTVAAIFNFYNSGGLGRERNLYQGGEWRSKRRSWERWGNEYFATLSSFPTPSPSIHSTSKSNIVIGISDCELRNVNLPP